MGDSNDKTYLIRQKHSQIMVVNILHNCGHMYYSHHKIIKCVSFESIYYTINPNVALLSKVFSEFDSPFSRINY